jgi:hypothetical protein
MRVECGWLIQTIEESLTLYYVSDENVPNSKASYSYNQP